MASLVRNAAGDECSGKVDVRNVRVKISSDKQSVTVMLVAAIRDEAFTGFDEVWMFEHRAQLTALTSDSSQMPCCVRVTIVLGCKA